MRSLESFFEVFVTLRRDDLPDSTGFRQVLKEILYEFQKERERIFIDEVLALYSRSFLKGSILQTYSIFFLLLRFKKYFKPSSKAAQNAASSMHWCTVSS